MGARLEDRDQEIVATTIRLLESGGYDAVQVRRVAAEASISLSTLYKLYGSRDELIVTALERWMADNAYAEADVPGDTDDPAGALAATVRNVFAPMERQPHMLAAIIRARMGRGGRRLDNQGIGLLVPKIRALLAAYDPAAVADLEVIVEHVNLGATQRFAAGEIPVTDIAPILERTIRRVLAANPPGRPPELC